MFGTYVPIKQDINMNTVSLIWELDLFMRRQNIETI